MLSKKNFKYLSIFSILLVLLFVRHINEPVKGRHAWAMADHFAIAQGFLNNNFDFFHPETYCLNPQFTPGKIKEKTTEYWSYSLENAKGTTAIDFPIHHYAIALLTKIFHTKTSDTFRMYMLFVSLLGLFYLCKTVLYVTKSKVAMFFLLAFVTLAPTYSYYAIGFLPSAASLAFLFIASYYVTRYFETPNNTLIVRSLIFLLIAGMARFPFTIYLLGLLGILILKSIKQKKIAWFPIISNVLCLLVIFGYFYFNKFYLSYNFGSNFLNYPIYIKSFQHLVACTWGILYYESWRYMTIIHYALLLGGIIVIYKKRSNLKIEKKYKWLFYYISLVTLGVFLYSILMFPQFVAHDYYILDTFFPVLLFWMIGSFRHLDTRHVEFLKKYKVILLISSLILNLFVFKIGYDHRPDSNIDKTRVNFTGSSKTLDSLNISKDAKILLINSYSPNLAFIGLERKGYCVMNVNSKSVKRALSWNFDYIITQNFNYSKLVEIAVYPEFENETEIFYSNEAYTIHVKK